MKLAQFKLNQLQLETLRIMCETERTYWRTSEIVEQLSDEVIMAHWRKGRRIREDDVDFIPDMEHIRSLFSGNVLPANLNRLAVNGFLLKHKGEMDKYTSWRLGPMSDLYKEEKGIS